MDFNGELPLEGLPQFPSMNEEDGKSIEEEDILTLIDSLTTDNVDDGIPPSPGGLMLDDDQSPYIGLWKKMTESYNSGSSAVKAEIDRYLRETGPFFDITFRSTFTDFIERKCWYKIDPFDDEPNGKNMARANAIVKDLLSEILTMLNRMGSNAGAMVPQNFTYQLRWLSDEINKFINNGQVMEIVGCIKRNLDRELYIVSCAQHEAEMASNSSMFPGQMSMPGSSAVGGPDNHFARVSEISDQISELERLSQRAGITIRDLTQRVQDLQHTTDKINRIYESQFNEELQKKWQGIQNKWQEICNDRERIITEEKNLVETCYNQPLNMLQTLLHRVLNEELVQWQRNQAYSNNGKNITSFCTIEHLENWCKSLAKLIKQSHQQLNNIDWIEVQLRISSDATGTMMRKYELMLQQLVEGGLVVERQPPQVLMKDKKFVCKLRHLVSDGLDIHQVPFEVETYLVNAEQATKVLKEGPKSTFANSGKIVNNVTRSEFIDHMQQGQLLVNMRNMSLKMQQRGAARNAEMVAELKFAMLFRAHIPVRFLANTATFTAQTISLPIVVISHGKQDADAQATIFWDNAFSKVGRTPFEVDDTVPWSWMLDALDARWKKGCEDGGREVGLTARSKEYLTMKLFKDRQVPNNTMISWKAFNHDKLFSCPTADSKKESFTFWTWFYKALELIKHPYIIKYWNASMIDGFLSKADCHKMLTEVHKPGVFLFRFSETKLGAISISCSTDPKDTGQTQVRHLQPDIIKDFKIRSLPDMVRDLGYLKHLYPDRSKDEVFGAYYTKEEQNGVDDNGYWHKKFIVQTSDMARDNGIPNMKASPGHFCFGDSGLEDMQEDHKPI